MLVINNSTDYQMLIPEPLQYIIHVHRKKKMASGSYNNPPPHSLHNQSFLLWFLIPNKRGFDLRKTLECGNIV
jgi:hypothetical protein